MRQLGEPIMAEQEAVPQLRTERSPDYRRLFSNHFFLRFAPGDANITFSQLIDVPGSTSQDVIQEQVNITMSWTQLKMLGEYISSTVQAMEREVGPITSMGLSIEELQKQSNDIIKGFVIRKK